MRNNIKLYREEKGVTQEELARRVDISLTQLRNIEKGRTLNPSIEIGIKLKRALGVENIEDLFNIDEY